MLCRYQPLEAKNKTKWKLDKHSPFFLHSNHERFPFFLSLTDQRHHHHHLLPKTTAAIKINWKFSSVASMKFDALTIFFFLFATLEFYRYSLPHYSKTTLTHTSIGCPFGLSGRTIKQLAEFFICTSNCRSCLVHFLLRKFITEKLKMV